MKKYYSPPPLVLLGKLITLRPMMVVFNTVTEVMVAQRSGGVSIFVETLKIWQNMTWAT